MSYDLFFYKRKGSSLTEQAIRDYLGKSIAKPEKGENWKVKTRKHFGRVRFENYNIKSN